MQLAQLAADAERFEYFCSSLYSQAELTLATNFCVALRVHILPGQVAKCHSLQRRTS